MTPITILLDQAEDIARAAGALLLGHFGQLRREDADRKGGIRRDLVSRADREAEELLVSRVPNKDDLMGEEGSQRSTGARRCWIIDPLDGTVNFLHGIPFWAVSIGVVEDDELVAAVVHAPALNETFTASAGGGSRCNGQPIAVSSTGELAEAVLASGFGYNRNEQADNNLDNWTSLSLASAGLRRMGAASLDLAYTASGRFDGFWELHLSPWDVAGGILVVREAGGKVSNFAGNEELERLLHGRNLVASNSNIHSHIRAHLAALKGIKE